MTCSGPRIVAIAKNAMEAKRNYGKRVLCGFYGESVVSGVVVSTRRFDVPTKPEHDCSMFLFIRRKMRT